MKRTPLKRHTPLKAKSRLKSRAPLRKRARKPKRGQLIDLEYLAWVHTQPSIATGETADEMRKLLRMLQRVGCFPTLTGKIEAHHVGKPRNDRRTVPLEDFFHRLTLFSVHGGGGPKKFQARFDLEFEAHIQRLNAKYVSEGGKL